LVPYKGDAFEIITMINEMFSSKDFKQKNQKVQKFMEEFGNEEVKIQIFPYKPHLY